MALAARAPTTAGQLSQLKEELARADVNTWTSKLARGDTSSEGMEAQATFDRFWTQLQGLRHEYTRADMQARFVEACQDVELPIAEEAVASRVEAARRRQEELEHAIKEEARLHEALRLQLAERTAGSRRLHDRCSGDLAELAHAQGAGFDSAHAGAGGANEIGVLRQLQETRGSRATLETELRQVEASRAANHAAVAADRQREEQEVSIATSHKALADAERELGLPDLRFDDAKGVIVLGAPQGNCAAEALRTVFVEFAPDGRLTRAEAHVALGLNVEEAAAVAHDDLARLLTAAWGKLCGDADGAGSHVLGAGVGGSSSRPQPQWTWRTGCSGGA